MKKEEMRANRKKEIENLKSQILGFALYCNDTEKKYLEEQTQDAYLVLKRENREQEQRNKRYEKEKAKREKETEKARQKFYQAIDRKI